MVSAGMSAFPTSMSHLVALRHFRCPENPEFGGNLPALLGAARTPNWYDPCSLLGEDG